jgi:hypothetical protein
MIINEFICTKSNARDECHTFMILEDKKHTFVKNILTTFTNYLLLCIIVA